MGNVPKKPVNKLMKQNRNRIDICDKEDFLSNSGDNI